MLEILRRALPLLPLSAAQQFTRLLLTMLLAQWMTPTHFGAFATLYALIEILIQPATLGFAQAIVRFGVGYFRRAEYALLQGLHWFSLVTSTTAGMLLSFILLQGMIPFVSGSVTHEGSFYLLAAAPFGALVQIQAGYLLSTGRPGLSMLSKRVLPELLTLGIAGLIILFVDDLSIHEGLWAVSLGFVMALLFQVYAIRLHSPVGPSSARAYRSAEWLRIAPPLVLGAAGTLLITRLDILFVRFLENEEAVALFFPAFIIAGLTMIPADAISTVCRPLLALGPDAENSAAYRALIVRCSRALLLANTLSVVLLALAGSWLLAQYGERHPAEALPVLLIMLAGRLLLPLRIVSNSLLKLVGNPWYGNIAFVAGSLVAVTAALGLHTVLGLAGIALGFSLGFISGVMLRLAMVRFSLGIPVTVMLGIEKRKG